MPRQQQHMLEGRLVGTDPMDRRLPQVPGPLVGHMFPPAAAPVEPHLAPDRRRR